MDYQFNPDDIILAKLTDETSGDLANFDCGDEEMNRFLRTEAFHEQELGMNTTTLLYYKGDLAAFCSICNDSLLLHRDERTGFPIGNVPAIKIARLGRDVRCRQRRTENISMRYDIYQ